MIKFPSIEQFRTVIRHVQNQSRFTGVDENGDAIYNHALPLPTLAFTGTVKLHGTNAGIVYNYKTSEIEYQSRERVLSLTSDNAGFMLFMEQHRNIVTNISNQAFAMVGDIPTITNVAIYGEWCGSGIQKGVALTQLPKMFVIFAIRAILEDKTSRWLDVGDFNIHHPEQSIYSIKSFPTWSIDIDFANPELSQNKMIEITEAVEAECPVGLHFGVSGIGEGVVWTCDDPKFGGSGSWFKVKGEKHSVSKVKTLAAVDVEAVENLKAFVEATVTEARLEQGLDNLVREQLNPFEMASMGDFIRWVFNDVIKEEMDTIVASQLDPKKLGGPIANKARPWFINKLNGGS